MDSAAVNTKDPIFDIDAAVVGEEIEEECAGIVRVIAAIEAGVVGMGGIPGPIVEVALSVDSFVDEGLGECGGRSVEAGDEEVAVGFVIESAILGAEIGEVAGGSGIGGCVEVERDGSFGEVVRWSAYFNLIIAPERWVAVGAGRWAARFGNAVSPDDTAVVAAVDVAKHEVEGAEAGSEFRV